MKVLLHKREIAKPAPSVLLGSSLSRGLLMLIASVSSTARARPLHARGASSQLNTSPFTMQWQMGSFNTKPAV
jgi:hypothetical protein